MKAIIVLIVLVGALVGGVYFFGGYQSFDPNKQGETAKAAIKPGMSWTQVLSIAGENPKLQTISLMKKKVGEDTVEERRTGPQVEFNKEKVADHLAKNDFRHGFILCYYFSAQVAFDVEFDGTGVVTSVTDAATIADLLQTRGRK